MERSILKGNAKEQLRGKWPLAIGVTFVFGLITQLWNFAYSYTTSDGSGVTFTVGALGIIALLVGGPLSVGLARFVLKINRGEDADFGDLFSAFNIYGKATLVYIIVNIIIYVGTFLLIIPGVIASLMLAQVFFILADDENISIMDCLKKSVDIMDGNKGELFILQLSFIGWIILTVFTCGLGMIVLVPYMEVTYGNFYLEVSKNKEVY